MLAANPNTCGHQVQKREGIAIPDLSDEALSKTKLSSPMRRDSTSLSARSRLTSCDTLLALHQPLTTLSSLCVDNTANPVSEAQFCRHQLFSREIHSVQPLGLDNASFELMT